MKTVMKRLYGFACLLLFPLAALAQSAAAPSDAPWHFVVGGDSRNCGDVIMPAIAEGAKKDEAEFYWHLGDWRAIYTFDEDMVQASAMTKHPLQVQNYLMSAFQDAIDNQLTPFRKLGIKVYAGIGNHETIWPMTRGAFIRAFHAYLDQSDIRKQRTLDDPYSYDLPVRTYYHVIIRNIDFITLDNGSCDMFDETQMMWLTSLLDRAAANPAIHAVVVGMHAALPDSRACGHSMSNFPRERETGRRVYRMLLDVREKHHKQVYILASHSHFVMNDVYDTDYWRANGGVLPGWIIGTSGAVRYRLPETVTPGSNVRTDVYGYLLASVNANGAIGFQFREVTENDVPADIKDKYSEKWVKEFCFEKNQDPNPKAGTCPSLSQCSAD